MNKILSWLDKKLEYKIFSLILLILILSFGFVYFLISNMEKNNLIDNENQKSKLVADTIHETLERDMMAFRADVVRGLMGDFKKLEGILRIQIVRGDAAYVGDGSGKDEAFMDYKTLNDVKKRLPTLYKPEWERNHQNLEINIASGTENPEFQKYYESFKASLGEITDFRDKKDELMKGLIDVSYFEEVNGRKALTYLRPLPNFPRCVLCHGSGYNLRGVLMISTDTEKLFSALTKSKSYLLMANGATVILMLILLRFLINRVVLSPLSHVSGHLQKISEGEGDLTQRINVDYKDEIGSVALFFNKFVQKLQHIISSVFSASIEIKEKSEEILKESKDVVERANVQLSAIEDTSKAVETMNQSIMEIADSSETLTTMADESAVAVIEMSSSIDEIARSAAVLSASVEESTSSILEMSSSAKQIDENVSVLENSAQATLDSMNEMNTSIKYTQANIHEMVELSNGVMRDTEKGKRSAEMTIRGIGKVQDYSNEINSVIQNLKGRVENIGTILNVIDEVAEQTNLLALNAAIIAAQAGVHGKSFGVVAQEIKELADRTATSTKEIHEIIGALQNESSNAVTAIKNGGKSVEEGVRLSQDVGEALNQIMINSRQFSVRVKEIAGTADEQTERVNHVADAMKKVTDMTKQIARATGEQTRSSELIINTTERMKDIAINVKGATQQQSGGNKRINEIAERVNQRVKEIAQATGAQANEVTNILSSINQIRDVIGQNVDANGKVGLAVEEMMEQAKKLYEEISKFKV